MAKRLAIQFCLLASLVSACAVTPPATPKLPATVSNPPIISPTPITTVIENAGRVCFSEFDKSAKELRGTFRPKGCFSSSCTLPLEQKVDVKLDDNQSAIKFITRFVLADITVRTPEPQPCTADCDGGGRVNFKIGDMKEGNYTIWLGDRKLGNLEVPPNFSTAKDICFGENF